MGRVIIAGMLFLAACNSTNREKTAAAWPDTAVDTAILTYFQPLPATIESNMTPATPEKIALGRMLYYDTRFSKTGDISCYVCHPLHDYGTSHRPTGVGHNALVGARNEPTVYNAAGQIAQFWDGRAADVEAQAVGPVTNPIEMGMANDAAVLTVLNSIPTYVAAFKSAFPNDATPVSFANFGRAIGAFERGLLTPARWDDYLNHDSGALTAEEKSGLKTFVSTGCTQCHAGAYVGGTMYRKAGVLNTWFNTKDEGRSKVTGNPADKLVFKVPSLRNVQETWPYFHDGSVQRLNDAVRLMAWHQLGKQLSDEQVTSVVMWLRALSGTVPYDYIQEPILPPAKKTT